jgi:RND family efflux transporter MFP subunit
LKNGKVKHSYSVLLIVLMLLLPLLSSCKEKVVTEHEKAQVRDETVDTASVIKKEVPSGVEYSGTVISERTALVAPKVMALIEDMTVKEGDLVDRGQLLAKLDGRDIEAKVTQAQAGVSQAEATYERTQAAIRQADASYSRAMAGIDEGKGAMIQAQANLELAKKNLDRFKDLYAEDSIPAARLEEVQAQYKFAQSGVEQVKGKIAQARAGENEALSGKAQAQAAREEARSGVRQAHSQVDSASIMLSYTSLYAPFKGVVTKKFYETGAMAAPGQPLLRLESLNYLQLEISIPEGAVKDIPLHKPVTLSIDALNKKVKGLVRTYIPSGDAATHTFKVKIDLPAVEGLLPGMYGRLILKDMKREALMIPAEALVQRGKTTGVFRVLTDGDKEKAIFTPVEPGQKAQDEVEVLRGLSLKDTVVVTPPEGLIDGQPVRTRKRGS